MPNEAPALPTPSAPPARPAAVRPVRSTAPRIQRALASAHPLTSSVPVPPAGAGTPGTAGTTQALPVAPKAVPLRRSAPAPTAGQPTVTPVRHAPGPVPRGVGGSTPVQRTHPTPPRPPIAGGAPAQPPVPSAPAAVRIQRMAAPKSTPRSSPPPPSPPPPPASSAPQPKAQQAQQAQQAQAAARPSFNAKDLDDHQLDELTHRLIDRVTRKVRTELRLDRERIGKLRDPRH
ncbi:extensin [Streptomyces sp. NPDC020898]|uniref:extensin n=1 Tax=Streptomyces sp. NPDC020898 TaxID=3365101 RepID=UPI003790660A